MYILTAKAFPSVKGMTSKFPTSFTTSAPIVMYVSFLLVAKSLLANKSL